MCRRRPRAAFSVARGEKSKEPSVVESCRRGEVKKGSPSVGTSASLQALVKYAQGLCSVVVQMAHRALYSYKIYRLDGRSLKDKALCFVVQVELSVC